MKREALIRELNKTAKKLGMTSRLDKAGGKGSHYRYCLGDKWTTLKSGELKPHEVTLIKKQLGVE